MTRQTFVGKVMSLLLNMLSRLVITFLSLVARRLKHLPAMQETWVQSLGQEDPPEKKMATPVSILAWEIPWTEKPVWLQSTGWQRDGHGSD